MSNQTIKQVCKNVLLSLILISVFPPTFAEQNRALDTAIKDQNEKSIADEMGLPEQGSTSENKIEVDHSKMDHGQMSHGEMDHSKMNHAQPGSDSSANDNGVHQHGNMRMDMKGMMVMGEMKDTLPAGCSKISKEYAFTVRAGRKYAQEFNGTMYGYDQHEFEVEPCSKVTVTLINEDNIRHQWMLHGLPRYYYPNGMFHLEVTGSGKVSGTFIAPNMKKTLMAHCDISQHTEKGMKAQFKIGRGDGDLPGVPGVSAYLNADSYPVEWKNSSTTLLIVAMFLVAFLFCCFCFYVALRHRFIFRCLSA